MSIYYFPTDEDDEGITFKEKALEYFLRSIDVFCVWNCCPMWVKIQDFIALLVFDPFVELFITLCIVVNTLFMALDHHDMDSKMEKILKSGNYVSFSLENKKKNFFRFRNLEKKIIIVYYLKKKIVLHCNVWHWSDNEIGSNESKVLLSRRMEHFRFHYSGLIPAGIGTRGSSGIIGPSFI